MVATGIFHKGSKNGFIDTALSEIDYILPFDVKSGDIIRVNYEGMDLIDSCDLDVYGDYSDISFDKEFIAFSHKKNCYILRYSPNTGKYEQFQTMIMPGDINRVKFSQSGKLYICHKCIPYISEFTFINGGFVQNNDKINIGIANDNYAACFVDISDDESYLLTYISTYGYLCFFEKHVDNSWTLIDKCFIPSDSSYPAWINSGCILELSAEYIDFLLIGAGHYPEFDEDSSNSPYVIMRFDKLTNKINYKLSSGISRYRYNSILKTRNNGLIISNELITSEGTSEDIITWRWDSLENRYINTNTFAFNRSSSATSLAYNNKWSILFLSGRGYVPPRVSMRVSTDKLKHFTLPTIEPLKGAMCVNENTCLFAGFMEKKLVFFKPVFSYTKKINNTIADFYFISLNSSIAGVNNRYKLLNISQWDF